MSKVSIIIPAYNVEKYIGRCLDSILAQTFQDFEIILVDDCSQDNTVNVVQRYVSQDVRVRLIRHGENLGPMQARAHGWQSALGDFIVFCDSDDCLPCTALQNLYEAIIESHADVVCGAYQVVGCDGTFGKMWSSSVRGDRHVVYKALLQSELSQCLCGKIYRKGLFDDSVEAFAHFTNAEDALTLYQIVAKCTYVTSINKVVYYYYEIPESSSRRRLNRQQLLNIVTFWNYSYVYLTTYPDLLALYETVTSKKILSLVVQGYDKRIFWEHVVRQEVLEKITPKFILQQYPLYKAVAVMLLFYCPWLCKLSRQWIVNKHI